MFNSNNAVEELDDAVTHLNLGEQDTESINTAVREDLSENVPERQHAYSQDFNQQELPTMQPQQEHVLQPQQTLPTMQGGPLPGQNPPRQRVADAFNYLNVVKQTFVNQPQVYSQFLEIMKQFKLQQLDTASVIQKVIELFAEHNDIIIGFNSFLPQGFQITLQDVEQYKRNRDGQQQDEETKTETQEPQEQTLQTTSRPPDFNQAINYVTKIKKRFENDPVVYKSFLDILHNYQRQQTTVQHVYDQFAVLFKDHADLLAEFAYFLPSK